MPEKNLWHAETESRGICEDLLLQIKAIHQDKIFDRILYTTLFTVQKKQTILHDKTAIQKRQEKR